MQIVHEQCLLTTEPSHRKSFVMTEGSLYSSYVAICVCNLFLCYTAIMLNNVTIHAIRKTPSLPKTLKTLLLSLTVSDLGVGLLVQPSFVVRLVMEMEQNSGNNPFFVATSTIFSFASFFGVIALSADRFLAIHFFLSYKDLVTHKRVVAVVISIWLFSAFPSLIILRTPQNIFYLIFAIIDLICEIAATCLTSKVYRAARSHLNELQAMELCSASITEWRFGERCKVEEICNVSSLHVCRILGLLFARHLFVLDFLF